MAGEDALDLPALTVPTTREAAEEPTAVATSGNGPWMGPRVDGDGREGDAQRLAAEAMVVLAVETGIGKDSRQ